MTPKEKAKELYDRMYALNDDDFISDYISKATALIAVDEIMDFLCEKDLGYMYYWEEVKREIHKL